MSQAEGAGNAMAQGGKQLERQKGEGQHGCSTVRGRLDGDEVREVSGDQMTRA